MTRRRPDSPTVAPTDVRKARAMDLILEGKSITAIAKEIGVTRQAVHAWRRDPAFDEEIRRRHDEISDAAYNKLMAHQLDALEQLVSLMNDEETGDTARIHAIRAYWELLGKHKGAPVKPPEAGGEPETLEELLEVLKGVPVEVLQQSIAARQPKEREL